MNSLKKRKKLSRKQVGNKRNWSDMPGDIMILIFLKLDTTDILSHVQFVCSSWQKLAKEPRLFRKIKCVLKPDCSDDEDDLLTKIAVDRSRGGLREFYNENYCTDDVLCYVVNESKSLRSFRVCHANIICGDVILQLARKHPLLEELEFSEQIQYYGIEIVIKEVGRSCLQLKSLTLTLGSQFHGACEIIYEIALAIAENMPQLRSLRISGEFTAIGCKAILDRCSDLECFDLHKCYFDELAEWDSLKNFEGRIKYFRLPSTQRDHL